MGKHSEDMVEVSLGGGDAVVASFTNSDVIPNTVSLEMFTNNKKPMESILHGESIDGELKYDADELNDSKYVLGVYDSKSGSIKLIPNTKFFSGRVNSSKTLINDAKLIKKLKRKDISSEGTFAERRNALGEEFGTKKAKKAINEAVKNKIDSGMLESSQIDIVDGIRETTKSMPNREEMAKLVERENRVAPPCYPDATNVEDIYPINEIVPDEILELFPVDIFFNAEKEEGEEGEEGEEVEDELVKKMGYLPFVPSKERGVEQQKKSTIGRLLQGMLTNMTDDNRWKLQLLSYTSMLLGLYYNRRITRRDNLIEKYVNLPPSRAMNYMLQLHGKIKNGSNLNFDKEVKFYNIGPKEEDKLLCYIIVLLLSLFEYRIELSTLASDLSLKPSKLLALIRTLGCTVVATNKSDGKDYAGSKVATLRVPFKLPELVRRFKR